MSEFNLGARVRAATMRAKDEFLGEIVTVETKLRGAWYHVRRDIDGEIVKVRAAKMKLI